MDCETVVCRHSVFSKYFGDKAPLCGGRCDVCKDGKSVERRIGKLQACGSKRLGFNSKALSVDGGELYGDGRRGMKREADGYGGDDDEGDGGRSREKQAKMDRENIIKKQFQLRKGKSKDDEDDEKASIGYAKVKAAEFTSGKIAGLEVRTREDYLGLVESSLARNYEVAGEVEKRLQKVDILDAAVEAEYEVFTNNKVVTMYRKKMAVLIQSIKKDTGNIVLHKALADYKPKQKSDLASLAKIVTHEISSQAASKNEVTEHGRKQSKEKISKEKKQSGFRLKRETTQQTNIGQFFTPATKVKEEKDDKDDVSGLNFYRDSHHQSEKEGISNSHINHLPTETNHLLSSESLSRHGTESEDCNKIARTDPVSGSKSPNQEVSSSVDINASDSVGPLKVHNMSESDSEPDDVSLPRQESCKSPSQCILPSLPMQAPNKSQDKINCVSEISTTESSTVRKLQEKIAQLSKEMREGMDHVNYVMGERAEKKTVVKSQEEQSSKSNPSNEKKGNIKKIPGQKSATNEDTSKSSPHLPDASKNNACIDKKSALKRSKSSNKNSDVAKVDKANKLKVADVLVKLLVPFLKTGQIACKNSFKVLARELTHLILHNCGGREGISSTRVQAIVSDFFSQQKEAVTEEKVKVLLRNFTMPS